MKELETFFFVNKSNLVTLIVFGEIFHTREKIVDIVDNCLWIVFWFRIPFDKFSAIDHSKRKNHPFIPLSYITCKLKVDEIFYQTFSKFRLFICYHLYLDFSYSVILSATVDFSQWGLGLKTRIFFFFFYETCDILRSMQRLILERWTNIHDETQPDLTSFDYKSVCIKAMLPKNTGQHTILSKSLSTLLQISYLPSYI